MCVSVGLFVFVGTGALVSIGIVVLVGTGDFVRVGALVSIGTGATLNFGIVVIDGNLYESALGMVFWSPFLYRAAHWPGTNKPITRKSAKTPNDFIVVVPKKVTLMLWTFGPGAWQNRPAVTRLYRGRTTRLWLIRTQISSFLFAKAWQARPSYLRPCKLGELILPIRTCGTL